MDEICGGVLPEERGPTSRLPGRRPRQAGRWSKADGRGAEKRKLCPARRTLSGRQQASVHARLSDTPSTREFMLLSGSDGAADLRGAGAGAVGAVPARSRAFQDTGSMFFNAALVRCCWSPLRVGRLWAQRMGWPGSPHAGTWRYRRRWIGGLYLFMDCWAALLRLAAPRWHRSTRRAARFPRCFCLLPWVSMRARHRGRPAPGT